MVWTPWPPEQTHTHESQRTRPCASARISSTAVGVCNTESAMSTIQGGRSLLSRTCPMGLRASNHLHSLTRTKWASAAHPSFYCPSVYVSRPPDTGMVTYGAYGSAAGPESKSLWEWPLRSTNEVSCIDHPYAVSILPFQGPESPDRLIAGPRLRTGI